MWVHSNHNKNILSLNFFKTIFNQLSSRAICTPYCSYGSVNYWAITLLLLIIWKWESFRGGQTKLPSSGIVLIYPFSIYSSLKSDSFKTNATIYVSGTKNCKGVHNWLHFFFKLLMCLGMCFVIVTLRCRRSQSQSLPQPIAGCFLLRTVWNIQFVKTKTQLIHPPHQSKYSGVTMVIWYCYGSDQRQ